MLEKIFSELDSDQKVALTKYAAVFAGGVAVGFAMNRVLESSALENIKYNAIKLADNYFNPKIEYVDEVEILDDEIIEE